MIHQILIAGAMLITTLAGCAGPKASGEYRSDASADHVFNAALHAVSALGYSVTGANRADGVITGSRGVVLGESSTAELTAIISREGSETVLSVNFTKPPMAIAVDGFSDGDSVSEFVSAVRSSVPDLTTR
jgi:hypothetical protein